MVLYFPIIVQFMKDLPEVYLQSFQTSTVELFTKIINDYTTKYTCVGESLFKKVAVLLK